MIKEYDLEKLEQYATHRRLQTFYDHGTECVYFGCSAKGTKLVQWKANDNSIHMDLFTDDDVMMTVEHVIPRSLGGKNHISNYLPACQRCNERRGTEYIYTDISSKKITYDRHGAKDKTP